MKKLLAIGLLLYGLQLAAQPYSHAAGIRAGYSSGLTYKGFLLHRPAAIEADFMYNPHGLNLSLLYQYHRELDPRGRWLVHAGGGLFGGQWDDAFSLGLSPGLGIEYVIRKTPLNFGLDWKPMLNLYRKFAFDPLDFGLSIRYRFSL